jgi:ABC-type polysaccharide/polyol phosphate export permease
VAGNALVAMTHLTRDTVFPKVLLVVAAVISSAVEFVVSMLICLVVAVATGVPITPAVALLPVVMLMQGWTVLWLSLLLACAYVFAKDTPHLHQVFLRILILATPIFYSPEFLGDGVGRFVLLFNPLAHFVEWSRALVIGGHPFPVAAFLSLAGVNALATYASVRIFQRCEPSFAARI